MQAQKIQEYLSQNRMNLPVVPCGVLMRVGPWTIDKSVNGETFELLIDDNDHYHLVGTANAVEGLLDIIIARSQHEARVEQS